MKTQVFSATTRVRSNQTRLGQRACLFAVMAVVAYAITGQSTTAADDIWKRIKEAAYDAGMPKIKRGSTTFTDGRGIAISSVRVANPTRWTIPYRVIEKGKWVPYVIEPNRVRTHHATGTKQVHPEIRFDGDLTTGTRELTYSLPGQVAINQPVPDNALPIFEFKEGGYGLDLFRTR